MSEIKICCNNVKRPIIQSWELTDKEKLEFDYLDWDKLENGEDSAEFFRYRGELYDMGEFSRITPVGSKRFHPMECSEPKFQGYDGYMSDSYFSGVLIKYPKDDYGIDTENIIVALYTS